MISFVSLAQLRSSGSISVPSAASTSILQHTRDELEDGRLGEGMLVVSAESLAVRHGGMVVVRLRVLYADGGGVRVVEVGFVGVGYR